MEKAKTDLVMMKTALLFAKEGSTCCRIQTGAVIAVDNRIVSTGYNGSVSGLIHCVDYFKAVWEKDFHNTSWEDFLQTKLFKDMHHQWSVKNEAHAEINAIVQAAKKGIAIEGGKIYTLYSPCLSCAKAIINSGLEEMHFRYYYDRAEGEDALKLLEKTSIKITQTYVN